jgi:hypothetical protein
MPKARIRALETILRALVERPEPGALVIACTDHEVLYIAWLLGQLDEEDPADRFCVLAQPFTTTAEYIAMLETTARAAITLPASADPDPTIRTRTLLHHLLADLPPGDHRLVFALIPSAIARPAEFAALVGPLLDTPIDPRLRLVLRDDRRHLLFKNAAESSIAGIYAYSFALPPELVLASVAATANDRSRPPDERAAALLQLACLDLGHGRHSHALARCEAAARLATSAPLRAFALAITADVLRHRGDHDAALSVGLTALRMALDADAPPIVQHAALALGELTRDLGRTFEAATCFEIAERSAALNPEVQARARDLRNALEPRSC